jgi:Ca2+-binding EF-hand superfamily protein
VDDIAASFQHLDKDNSLKLSTKELANIMKYYEVSAPNESLKEVIAEVDISKSLGITSADYLTFMTRHLLDEKSAKEHAAAELNAVFNPIAENGYVTRDGLKRAMQLIGENLTDDEVDLLIEEADADGDKKLDFKEFAKLFHV